MRLNYLYSNKQDYVPVFVVMLFNLHKVAPEAVNGMSMDDARYTGAAMSLNKV